MEGHGLAVMKASMACRHCRRGILCEITVIVIARQDRRTERHDSCGVVPVEVDAEVALRDSRYRPGVGFLSSLYSPLWSVGRSCRLPGPARPHHTGRGADRRKRCWKTFSNLPPTTVLTRSLVLALV